jgi:hypothetical protein
MVRDAKHFASNRLGNAKEKTKFEAGCHVSNAGCA